MMFIHLSIYLSVSVLVWDGALQRGFKFMVGYFNVLSTLTPRHVHLLPAVFSSSTWKRGGVWRAESRPGHSTVVSIRLPETVMRVTPTWKWAGVTGLVGGEHVGDVVCGRDCCY